MRRLLGRLSTLARVGLSVLVYAASSVVPRRADLWVFGAAGGTQFVGNPKYQFLHVAEAHEDVVRPVWITADDGVLDGLRTAGFEAYRRDSWRGRYMTLRAGRVFTSHGVGDVAKWFTRGAAVIQLWHGVALKRIGYDVEREWSLPGRVLFGMFASNWDRFVVTSQNQVEIVAGAYPIDADDIEVTGYPRNDALVRSFPGEDAVEADGADFAGEDAIEAEGAGASESWYSTVCDGPLVAYVPTWRRGFGDQQHGQPISESGLDLDRLDSLLDRHDAHLLVKLHPRDEGELDLGTCDRISSLPADADVYLTLRAVDVLITDYSSIYFDFLHLDRPILFFAYDLDEYARRPGFYFDYDAVTPGPVATSGDELLTELDDVLAGDDRFPEDRRRVRDRFFETVDGRAAERVYQCVRT